MAHGEVRWAKIRPKSGEIVPRGAYTPHLEWDLSGLRPNASCSIYQECVLEFLASGWVTGIHGWLVGG